LFLSREGYITRFHGGYHGNVFFCSNVRMIYHNESVEECCLLFSFVIVLVSGRLQVIALEGSYSDSCKHGAADFISGEVDGLAKYQL
jgi:hypothetical protein